jgi:hypothetical protein
MTENYQANGPGNYVRANPNKFANIIAALLGARAGMNHYQQDGDAIQAAAMGVGAFVRWMVWMIAVVVWFFGCWWIASWNAGSYLPMYLAFLIAPFTLGVTWCRNVDYCLFRRGIIYKVYAPIAGMVEFAPTWALYALLAVPLMAGSG